MKRDSAIRVHVGMAEAVTVPGARWKSGASDAPEEALPGFGAKDGFPEGASALTEDGVEVVLEDEGEGVGAMAVLPDGGDPVGVGGADFEVAGAGAVEEAATEA
jgi:hypothetical protein